MTRPASTPAAEATARMVVRSYPAGKKAGVAASRMRVAVRRGGDAGVRAAGHGVAVAAGGVRGGGAVPGPGPGGGDRGDAGEGDRDHDGPAAHRIVHPGPPDPGRPDRALPRLRRSPAPGRGD